MQFPIELKPAAELTPDPRNSRTHPPEQIELIKRLMLTVGFTQPILEGEQFIIAGHARRQAALELWAEGKEIPLPNGKGDLPRGMVPVVDGSGMSDEERRAYVIADNQSALMADWNEEILELELGELKAMDFDLSLTGFDPLEISSHLRTGGKGSDQTLYTRKIKSPVYEPKGKKPKIEELADTSKRDELLEEIRKARIPAELKPFLEAAAHRHTVFNFDNIAEFYAHASPKVQELFENSALVIIDFNKAIELGFVKLTEELEESYRSDYSDE